MSLNTHSGNCVRASNSGFKASDSTSLSVTGAMTIEFWFRYSSQPTANGDYYFVGKYQTTGADSKFSYGMEYYVYGASASQRVMSCFISTTGSGVYSFNSDSGVVLNANQWYHLAMVFVPSTRLTLYLDETKIGERTASPPATIYDSTGGVSLGFFNTAVPGNDCGADMDDVRIWSVARTVTELTNNKSLQLTGSEANLNAYWRLNNSLADQTANGNTLTNVNSATFTTAVPFPGSADATARRRMLHH